MGRVFIGSEALARGEVTRGQLRWRYRPIFPDVYEPLLAEPTLYARTHAAWLWSRRRAVITGRAAAALHGARWVPDDVPIELLWDNHTPPDGIVARNDRFCCDEVVEFDGMAVATPQRTAFDVGRHLPLNTAVAIVDALAAATGLRAEHVTPMAVAYKGARNVRRLRQVLDLMDGGSQSPKETWLRLLLIRAGLPRPRTQLPVFDDDGFCFAYLDMGYEAEQIAVEYDGDQHRTNRRQYVKDIERTRRIEQLGWVLIRVVNEDRPAQIVERVRQALLTRRDSSQGC